MTKWGRLRLKQMKSVNRNYKEEKIIEKEIKTIEL